MCARACRHPTVWVWQSVDNLGKLGFAHHVGPGYRTQLVKPGRLVSLPSDLSRLHLPLISFDGGGGGVCGGWIGSDADRADTQTSTKILPLLGNRLRNHAWPPPKAS